MIPSKRFVWGALLIGSAPFLLLYLTRMVSLPHYQYLPILILVLAGLIWKKWDRESRLPAHWFSWSFFYLGIAISLLGSWRNSPWLVAIGSILLLGVFLRSNLSKEGNESLFHLFPLAVFIIRLPMNLDERLVNYLQLVTANFGSQCLDRLHVPHCVMGNVFELASGSLFVEEACSGIQSLFTLLFVSVLIVVLRRRSNFLLPLYCASAIVWAVVMNTARIVIIAYAQHHQGWDLAHGWLHEALGYLCLFIAITMMISSDAFFLFLFSPISVYESGTVNKWRDAWNWVFTTTTKEETEKKRSRKKSDRERSKSLFPVAILSVSVLLVILQSIHLYPGKNANLEFAIKPFLQDKIIYSPERDDIGRIGGFHLTDYQQLHDRRHGQLQALSDTWSGFVMGVPVRIALTQAYTNWHDLTICYQGLGWNQNERKMHQFELGGDNEGNWNYCSSSFLKPNEFGYLAFSCFDRNGKGVNPQELTMKEMVEYRFGGNKNVQSADSCVMIQVWATSNSPLSQDQVQAIERLHLESREALRKRAFELATASSRGDN